MPRPMNTAGTATVDIRPDAAALTLGADGQDGDIFILDSTGATTISCDGNSGKIVCKSLEQSDGRLKTDIAPLAGALDDVLALRGVRYRRRRGTAAIAAAADGPPEIGFVGQEVEEDHTPHWSTRQSLIVLAVTTLAVVWLSEILVGSVEPVTHALGLSEFFIGIILIPIIGNVAEHLVAVEVSLKNKIELSLEIALSSSQQIALFVAPVLVFISLLFGHRLTLVFNTFELVALVAAVGTSALVSMDGETNWLEGAQLVGVYLILAVAFFFVQG